MGEQVEPSDVKFVAGAPSCVACGGREGLHPLDDAGYVWFCAECLNRGSVADLEELMLELGGAG